MSANTTYQPFECFVCQQRFTRHENLKRHATRHADERKFQCELCDVTFSRRDLKHRHLKRKHPGYERSAEEQDTWRKDSRQRQRSNTATSLSSGLEDERHSVQRYGAEGADARRCREKARKACQMAGNPNTPSSTSSASLEGMSPRQSLPDGLSPSDCAYLLEDWSPSVSQTVHGYQLYFQHVSHFVPFLHRPTFDATETPPYLGLGMLCLAYQHGEDPDYAEDEGSGFSLSLRCFHRARALAALEEDHSVDSSQSTTLAQAYWMLEICAMLYLCGDYSGFGLRVHSRMISLARSGGLTQPLQPDASVSQDLDGLWMSFVKAESHKRTMLAIHQLDVMWYQFLSVPRSLSHLEIKHDLPCPQDAWTASSAARWAHLQLVRPSAPSVTYSDAIRKLLSSNLKDLSTLPPFDPWGAINIAQFLLSSAREISGWSTMTGHISLDRFMPLRSSLIELERYIRPSTATGEATWEMAMIELQMWSPSHTCGIVEGSVDAVFWKSTQMAKESDQGLVGDLKHHVDWFLRYLDKTVDADDEPPWIVLYAYKAFLVAWQLVRRGDEGVMSVIADGEWDTCRTLEWARAIFGRRGKRAIGKIVLKCLNALEDIS